MKKTPFKKRNSPLKAKTGFKQNFFYSKSLPNLLKIPHEELGGLSFEQYEDMRYKALTSYKKLLKRSSFKKKTELTPQQQLDSIVSKVVRISSADDNGMVKCATCPNVLHWTQMQCGHYQRRGNIATRYDMTNLAPQCEDCNCFKDGMEKEFAVHIDRVHGKGTAKKLYEKAHGIAQGYPYDQEIIKWSAVLEKLQNLKGNDIKF